MQALPNDKTVGLKTIKASASIDNVQEIKVFLLTRKNTSP